MVVESSLLISHLFQLQLATSSRSHLDSRAKFRILVLLLSLEFDDGSRA